MLGIFKKKPVTPIDPVDTYVTGNDTHTVWIMEGITIAHALGLIKCLKADVVDRWNLDTQGALCLKHYLADIEMPDIDIECGAIFDVRSAHMASITQADAICKANGTTLQKLFDSLPA